MRLAGERRVPEPGKIWERLPKFILGFVALLAVSLWLAVGTRPEIARALAAAGEANSLCAILFVLVSSRQLAAVYFIGLFAFMMWVGPLVSRLFFCGFEPPLA